MRAVIITIGVLFLVSCQEPECRETPIASKPVDVTFDRLESELFAAQSQEEVEHFLQTNPAFASLFLDAAEYPSLEVLADKIFKLTSDPFVDTLYNEAIGEFSDFSTVEESVTDAVGRIKTLVPGMKDITIQTAVTGLYKDLYISDTLVIVGLDFFIGDDASYPPMNIPQYILDRYDKEHLPVTIVKFLSGSLVSKGKSETLISEMIDFGKTYYLLSRLMPCTPDSLIIGYSPKQMETVLDNEAIIWANFVENEVLYDANHLTKRKFLGERPNVYEISQECPGRIGAWIGWRIVESYMRNSSEVTLEQLISERDNDLIFRKSSYKPKG
ncbi:MAG: hypothetical protein ABJ004_04940 [Cyclobacteriaceae bacterium]